MAFGCGIYAAKSVEVLMDEVDGDLGRQFVVGLVGLEGRVVEHDRGYRGEQATVLAVTIVNRGTLLMTDDAGELQRMFRDPRRRRFRSKHHGLRPGATAQRDLPRRHTILGKQVLGTSNFDEASQNGWRRFDTV